MKNQLTTFPFIDQVDDVENNEAEKSKESLSVFYPPSLKGKADREIWSAFQNGNEGAFTFIYDHYFETLYNYGCQFTSDTGLVEDLLQDFFVDLRLKIGKNSKVSYIKAYLLKSFRRKIIRHLKKKKVLIFTDGFAEGDFKISFRPDMHFMETQFHLEQQKYLGRMLNKLAPREREAVYYFYFENLDYKSISQIMGLSSTKSARNLIYKALTSLKKNKQMFPDWLQYSMLLWL